MDAFSDILDSVQLRLGLLNIQGFSSRLLSHWQLKMGPWCEHLYWEITRHHKSKFLFYSESQFISIPLDAHFIKCKYGLFFFSVSLFWVVSNF